MATTYTITQTLTNITSDSATITITPDTGYTLPSSITVSGATLDSYNSTTGVAVLSNMTNSVSVSVECPEAVVENPYLTFSSPNTFTLAVANSTKNWDGTLEYSTDTTNWSTWDGTTTLNSSNTSIDLTGTSWYIDFGSVALSSAFNYSVNFTSNSTDFTQFRTDNFSPAGYSLYYNTTLAYNADLRQWSNTEYKVIHITGGTDVTDTNLITWLNANAKMIHGVNTMPHLYIRGSNNTYITGGTSQTLRWVLTGNNIGCQGDIVKLLEYSGNSYTMANNTFYALFRNNTSLTEAPTFSPLTLSASTCYRQMFLSCTSLVFPPELPATTLSAHCYRQMFAGCTSLLQSIRLPATHLPTGCYYAMFNGCTALVTALPILGTVLSAGSCYGMFADCTSLVVAPEFTVESFEGEFGTSASNGSCYGMFATLTQGTTTRRKPLADISGIHLNATTLANHCYGYMFQDCSITTPPLLPATILALGCYNNMFNTCTSLTSIPALPATTLAEQCYPSMFYYCTSIKLSTTQTGDYQTEYRIPTSGTGTDATNALVSMFTHTGGTFTGTPVINTTYYTSNTVIPATTS